jgi:hypothetical protein
MSMPWHTWSAIPNAPAGAKLSVTAIARSPTHIDLFQTGADGGVYSAYWDIASGWSAWFRLDDNFAKAATQISVVARNPNHMDLFVSGSDRAVYSIVWDGAKGWGKWFRIDAGFSNAMSATAAVARDEQHLDLFVVAPGGQVYSCYWSQSGGWANWFQLGGSLGAEPHFPVAVLSRSPTHLDLFVTGNDGNVYSAYWDANGGWAQWFKLATGLLGAHAPVTAVARDANHIDLFTLAASNVVFTCAWTAAGGWTNWLRVDNSFTARAGATVKALARTPGRLELFAPSKDGGVCATTWDMSDGGDRVWVNVDQLSKLTTFDVSVLSLASAGMNMFMTADDLSTNAVQAIYYDNTPGVLRKATIRFDTHNDDKDSDTSVQVFLKNRHPDSSEPDANSDFVSNLLSYRRFADTGTIDGAGPNPFLAWATNLGAGDTFDDPSTKTFDLPLRATNISVNEVVLPAVDIHILTTGDDRWIFDYTVSLYFDEGYYQFTSKTNGVNGIILDQDDRNYSGLGTINPYRTSLEAFSQKPLTDAILNRITLEFSTFDDDKNKDTGLNVHLVNRLADGSEHDLMIALDLFHGQLFPNDGTRDDKYRSITWLKEDNVFASQNLRLADMVLPVAYIIISPSGYDRWNFDYQLTFEFIDPADFNQKPHIYSTLRKGVILDQDNNKHIGIYSGPSFPRAAPPTAPTLNNAPIDRTGSNAKHIPVAFLQAKLAELVSDRTGPLGSSNPSLLRVSLSSTWDGVSDPDESILPESYADIGSLINGGDGVARYVSSGSSLGQLSKYKNLVSFFFGTVTSANLAMSLQSDGPTPFLLNLVFQPNGSMWGDGWGWLNILDFTVNMRFTLKKLERTDRDNNNLTTSVVDLMSWIDEIEGLTVTPVASLPPTLHFTGTFLGQPIDEIRPFTDPPSQAINAFKTALVEQVVTVHFNTEHDLDPGGTIRQTIRDTIYNKLKDVDVLSNRTVRDSFNSLVTSWLAGGIADDRRNTDGNNIFINDISIHGSDIVVDFRGPQFTFVPTPPSDWPGAGAVSTAHDFSPSTLANIDHIVVLTKENRSFDHMLGYLSLPVSQGGMGRQDVDGLKGGESNTFNGQTFYSFELAGTRFAPGPPNGYESMQQSINNGMMDGFVRSHAELNGDAYAGQVMGYHTGKHVYAFDALARDFTIGDRWFCSHPGPTFPNRFYELTGRMNLDARGFWEFENSSPLIAVFTPSIFDHLTGAVDPITSSPVTWRYFERGYCTLRFYSNYTFDGENVVSYDDPIRGFLASAQSGNLPSVSFIDPHFVDFPPGSNCDEPPSDVADGQALVQEIVEAVVAGPAWNKTLLLIVYDECGGFYDHVPPPAATRVSNDLTIQTVGLRVPALAVIFQEVVHSV